MPHHGTPVVEGRDAIEQFWWPDGPPTRVTKYSATQDEVFREGSFGFVRGTFVLVFEYAGQVYSNDGNYLALLKECPKGAWKISHRIWNDPVTATK